MKIYLLSVHNIGNNFGTTLQACALYDYVKSLGYETQIINYRPQYSYNKGKIGQLVKRILYYKDASLQGKRYADYYKKHSSLTKEVHEYDELSQFSDGDLYIIGSDQVWNPYYKCGQDKAYYLKFINAKKMSYSASVGQVLTEKELDNLCDLISDFKAISVREACSKEQLEQCGYKDVVHVVDPVFLHNPEYYIDTHFKKPFVKYILVYAVTYDEKLDMIIQQVKKQMNCPVVLLGGYRLQYKCDLYYRSAGPVEFTNLICNCDFFIANSFHGTAFSVIFNRQFLVVRSEVSPMRIESLLDKLGIDGRIIDDVSQVNATISDKIDYSVINDTLDEWIEKSKNFLDKSIRELLDKGD